MTTSRTQIEKKVSNISQTFFLYSHCKHQVSATERQEETCAAFFLHLVGVDVGPILQIHAWTSRTIGRSVNVLDRQISTMLEASLDES